MFTKDDLATFGIGLGAGVLWELGGKLVESASLFADPNAWLTSLGIGATAAAGRWILTWLALKGFKKQT